MINVYSGGTTHIYDDIPYENGDSETTSLKKVKGGYIGYVYFEKQELTISNSENTPCLVIRLQKQWL